MMPPEEKRTIIEFVYSREQPTGGFSFAHEMTPGIEDTYYALRILDFLSISYKNDRTKQFVLEGVIGDVMDSRLLYRTLWILRYLGVPAGDIDERLRASARTPSAADGAFLAYYSLLARLLVTGAIDAAERERFAKIPSKPFRYVSEVSSHVLLRTRLSLPVDEACVPWLRQAQSGDGGFGFLEYTTSFMENIYYALTALHALGAKPDDISGCERFIRCCRSNNGAYGRQLHAVPTLEATYHALVSLRLLEEMR